MPEEEKVVTPEGAEIQVEVPAVEVPVETTVEAIEEVPVVEIPPVPKKKTAQERIDEITRARRTAERELEYWRRIALEKEKPALKPPTELEPITLPGLPPRPTLEQFETTTAYEDALFAWYENKKSSEQAVAKQRISEEEGLRKFNRSAEKLRQEHEDFDIVIESPVFSPAMRLAILHSENGPLMAYHLGKPENREIADRIRTLPAESQFYEIGKIEAQVLLAKNIKKVPGAPPPITPVGVGGGGIIDESKLTTVEWMALEKKREIEKLKLKYPGG